MDHETAEQHTEETRQLRSENAQLDAQLTASQQHVQILEAERSAALNELSAAAGGLVAGIRELKFQRDKAESAVQQLNETTQQLRAELMEAANRLEEAQRQRATEIATLRNELNAEVEAEGERLRYEANVQLKRQRTEASAEAQQLEDRVRELEAVLAERCTEYETTLAQLQQATSHMEALTAELEKTHMKVEDANSRVAELEKELDCAKQDASVLKAKLVGAQEALQRQTDDFSVKEKGLTERNEGLIKSIVECKEDLEEVKGFLVTAKTAHRSEVHSLRKRAHADHLEYVKCQQELTETKKRLHAALREVQAAVDREERVKTNLEHGEELEAIHGTLTTEVARLTEMLQHESQDKITLQKTIGALQNELRAATADSEKGRSLADQLQREEASLRDALEIATTRADVLAQELTKHKGLLEDTQRSTQHVAPETLQEINACLQKLHSVNVRVMSSRAAPLSPSHAKVSSKPDFGAIRDLKDVLPQMQQCIAQIEETAAILEEDLHFSGVQLEAELSRKSEQVVELQKSLQEVETAYHQLLTHNNPKQRIHHHLTLKKENAELKSQIGQLQQQVANLLVKASAPRSLDAHRRFAHVMAYGTPARASPGTAKS